MPPPPTKTFPLIKTPTYSSTRGRRGTCSAATPLTLSPIAGMLGAAAASAGTGSIRVYLAIAVSACIDIVCKRVTNIAKDVRAMDRRFNKFKDSLNEIKNKLAFLRRGIIALIRNAGLLDIEYK